MGLDAADSFEKRSLSSMQSAYSSRQNLKNFYSLTRQGTYPDGDTSSTEDGLKAWSNCTPPFRAPSCIIYARVRKKRRYCCDHVFKVLNVDEFVIFVNLSFLLFKRNDILLWSAAVNENRVFIGYPLINSKIASFSLNFSGNIVTNLSILDWKKPTQNNDFLDLIIQ